MHCGSAVKWQHKAIYNVSSIFYDIVHLENLTTALLQAVMDKRFFRKIVIYHHLYDFFLTSGLPVSIGHVLL